MGKNLKKSKAKGDVAAIEVSTSLGVLTRAKTLALQKRCNSLSNQEESPPRSDSAAYLELRSRKLEKSKDLKKQSEKNCNLNPSLGNKTASSLVRGWRYLRSASLSCSSRATMNVEADDFEFSCGENDSDFEATERNARESTPCSVIRSSKSLGTPYSSTGSIQNGRIGYAVPNTAEIDEFFAYAEEEQQRIFLERYNYDVVNDLPLPGRYNWFQVNP